MTYLYGSEDDDAPPTMAVCDACGAEIDPDEWAECEIPSNRAAKEHQCAQCTFLGNRERDWFEWTHARGRL